MHTVAFDVSSVTGAGVSHCNLLIDGQDVGRLYLNESEKRMLIDTLRSGALSRTDVDITITEQQLYTEEEEFDLLDDD